MEKGALAVPAAACPGLDSGSIRLDLIFSLFLSGVYPAALRDIKAKESKNVLPANFPVAMLRVDTLMASVKNNPDLTAGVLTNHVQILFNIIF